MNIASSDINKIVSINAFIHFIFNSMKIKLNKKKSGKIQRLDKIQITGD